MLKLNTKPQTLPSDISARLISAVEAVPRYKQSDLQKIYTLPSIKKMEAIAELFSILLKTKVTTGDFIKMYQGSGIVKSSLVSAVLIAQKIDTNQLFRTAFNVNEYAKKRLKQTKK